MLSWLLLYPLVLLLTSMAVGPFPWGKSSGRGLVLGCRTWGANIPHFSHDFTQSYCTRCCPRPGSAPSPEGMGLFQPKHEGDKGHKYAFK